MCLISFAYKVHPEYPLILIANRDEFYNRPAREARFWEEEGYPEILAGKDLSAGGTWMGVDKSGRWSALTNYRDLSRLKKDPPSRGDLALNFLKQDISGRVYLNKVRDNAQEFNDFNLLISDSHELLHYSNVTDRITVLQPGIHGLSNALMNTPWPKVEMVKKELGSAVSGNNLNPSHLFEILADETKAEDRQLPETGLPIELERAVSPAFITSNGYGTRCSTLLLINRHGEIVFTERVFEPGTGKIAGERIFEFQAVAV